MSRSSDALSRAEQTLDALGHNLTAHPAREATDTADGNIAYWSCERCRTYFSDADGKQRIAWSDIIIDATGEMPLRFTALRDRETGAITVTLTATETIMLSSYRLALEWDGGDFTLIDAAVGQPEVFTMTETDDGQIAAACSGSAVVAVGEALARYTFSGGETGRFTLRVLSAEAEEGISLFWSGKTFIAELADAESIEKAVIDSVTRSGSLVSAAVSCSEPDAVILCAAYSTDGMLLAVRSAEVNGDDLVDYSFELDVSDFATAKVFVLDRQGAPLCAAAF